MLVGVHVHLIDGTFELFRHFYAVPASPRRRRPGGGRGARRAQLGARHARRRRHPRGRGHRLRDRVVPQSPVARPTRPATASTRCCGRSSALLEEALEALGRARLADGGVRGRRRAGGSRGQGRARPARGPGAHLHAGQGPGAVRARHAGRAARSAAPDDRGTRPAWWRGSASARPRSPTTSRWSATAPTASPGCRAGAPSRRPRCWPPTGTSKRFRTTTAPGRWTWPGPGRWRRR